MSRDLIDFGTRYAAAWSSQSPAQLASFYAENGSLIVNVDRHPQAEPRSLRRRSHS
jgi:hypothetical protein